MARFEAHDMPRPLKFLMFLLAVPLVFVGVALGYAATKPNHWHVHTSSEISAPPEAVHALLSRPRTWPEWSAWDVTRDGTLQSTFDGPEQGAGATWAWSGKELGRGRLVITTSTPPTGLEYELFFEGGDNPGHGTITLAPAGDGEQTIMTWEDRGDVGSGPIALLGRLMVPTIEEMLKADFDEGMRRLNRLASAGELLPTTIEGGEGTPAPPK